MFLQTPPFIIIRGMFRFIGVKHKCLGKTSLSRWSSGSSAEAPPVGEDLQTTEWWRYDHVGYLEDVVFQWRLVSEYLPWRLVQEVSEIIMFWQRKTINNVQATPPQNWLQPKPLGREYGRTVFVYVHVYHMCNVSSNATQEELVAVSNYEAPMKSTCYTL